MLPRALWQQLDGFDTRYKPAYYEDTDLAFRVRAQGLRVLVQPASRVIHDEGTSNGTDTGSGVKAYQVRNQAIFAARWATELAGHPAVGAVPSPALLLRGRRQVLILDEEVPQPDRDSGSLRQVNLIRLLLQGGGSSPDPARAYRRGDRGAAADGRGSLVRPFLDGVAGWLRSHGSRFDVAMLVRHHVAHGACPAQALCAAGMNRVRHGRPALPARAPRCRSGG